MASSYVTRLGDSPEEGIKAPVVATSTSNITLSGEQTIDGVAVVAGDRVLVNGQTDTTENGIYVAATSAWSRAIDFNAANDVVNGVLVLDANQSDIYRASYAGVYAPGTTEINFTMLADGAIPVVATVAALRLVETDLLANNDAIIVLGCLSAGDGGGGVWRWSATDNTSVDNTGTIVEGTGHVGAGRWLREDTMKGGIYAQWFGMVNDGSTDNATAIQAAVDAAYEQDYPQGGGVGSLSNIASSTSQSVILPAGDFVIASQINVPDRIHIKSAGRTVLRGGGTRLNKGLVWDGSVTGEVSGIVFANFSTALEFDTDNLAAAVWKIIDCEVHDCDVGIDSVSWDDSRSTLCVIDGLRFDTVDVVAKIYCDVCNIYNCFGRNAEGYAGAAFVIDSQLHCKDNLFVPLEYGADARWFDIYFSTNTRSALFEKTRFSGEGGGIPACYVMQDGNDTNRVANYVSFDDCYVSCFNGGPSGDGGAVILGDNTTVSFTPNAISFYETVVSGPSTGSGIANLVRTEAGNPPTALTPVPLSIFIDYTTAASVTSNFAIETNLMVEDILFDYLAPSVRAFWTDRRYVENGTGTITHDYLDGKILELGGTGATLTNIINAQDGDIAYVHTGGVGGWTVLDYSSGGSFHLAGSADYSMGPMDTLTAMYIEDYFGGTWMELSRSNN